MKRVLLFIISFLLCASVSAKMNYSNATSFANDYIKRFPNNQRYIITKNTNYGFNSSNSIVSNSSFKTGGLLNEQEFLISSGSMNRSYLFNGLTYFTMTESGSQVKVIDPKVGSGITSVNKTGAESGVRVTNYVMKDVKVDGNGTRVRPWRFIDRYNVKFEYDDTKITVNPGTATVPRGGWVEVDVIESAKYTYVPQTTCGVITNGKLRVTGITSDTTCTINYTLREYTVTLEANNGTLKNTVNTNLNWTLSDSNTKATKKILYMNPVGTLPGASHIERTGYTFKEWLNANTPVDSTFLITKDETLTANWEANKYTVTYNANGGSISPASTEQTYDSPYTGLHTPSRTGYTFVGWYKESALTNKITVGTTIVDTAANHTIYAKWSANKYTVTYNANGGSGSMANSEATYDANFVTRPNTFTRSGYTFNGWNEAANGSGTVWALTSAGVYENGNGTKPWKWTYTDNITLYAQWLINTTIPTASTYCTNPTYNGSAQAIVSAAGTGFTWSGDSQTNAGTYTVTATLKTGYIWADGSRGTKTISCSIAKATPTITLDATSGTTVVGYNLTFNEKASVAGKFTVTSSATGVATVAQANTNAVSANTNNLVTVTPVAAGTATITVTFTPTDTTNYNTITATKPSGSAKTYAVTVTNKVDKPTTAKCKTLTYTGSEQTLVNSAATGYTWTAGTKRTDAGNQDVTATLSNNYRWSDNTTAAVKINCSIAKATPTITLDATSGTTVVGYNLTFNEKASVGGKFTVTSSSTSVATVAQASSNTIAANTNNLVTVTPKAAGTSTVTVTFTPTDTTNYNTITASTPSGAAKTYAVTVTNKVAKPTTSKCKSLTYTGSSQTLVNAADTGYTWTAGSTRTAAGNQDVTATLSNNYRWSDNTTAAVKINCSIAKATPTITLSATSGTTIVGTNLTFNEQATVAGKFTVSSSDTGKATVAQASSNAINANTNNLVTVTPKAVGSATITVAFTPTDTTNYNNASSKTYAVTVANKVAKPTTSKCTTPTYNGGSQTIVNSADTGYTWTAGTTRTDAGSQNVTATLSSGYRWSDNTTGTFSISCSISPKQLSAPSPSINTSGKITWSAVTNASSYQVSIDGGSWTTSTSGSSSIPTTTNGTHTAAVRAVGTGNYATSNSSGNASATISNKIIINYTKKEQTCTGSYSFPSEGSLSYPTTCNANLISCNKSNYGKTRYECSQYRWVADKVTCESTKSGATIGCSQSCSSQYPSVEAHCTIAKQISNTYYCSCEDDQGVASSCKWKCAACNSNNNGACTPSNPNASCSHSNEGATKRTCGTITYTSDSYKYCYKTTYQYKNSAPTVYSCTAVTAPTCSATTLNKSYIIACHIDLYKQVAKKCGGSFSLGGESTADVNSCSENKFTCSYDTVDQVYRTCTAHTGCGSGTTPIGSKCIKIN